MLRTPSEFPEDQPISGNRYEALPGLVFSALMILLALGGGIWLYIVSLPGGTG